MWFRNFCSEVARGRRVDLLRQPILLRCRDGKSTRIGHVPQDGFFGVSFEPSSIPPLKVQPFEEVLLPADSNGKPNMRRVSAEHTLRGARRSYSREKLDGGFEPEQDGPAHSVHRLRLAGFKFPRTIHFSQCKRHSKLAACESVLSKNATGGI